MLRHFRSTLRHSKKPASVMVYEALDWLDLVLYNCKAQIIKYERWYYPDWRTVKPVMDFLYRSLYADPIGVRHETLEALRARECDLRAQVLRRIMPKKRTEGEDGKPGTP